jgi:hypothetical protein
MGAELFRADGRTDKRTDMTKAIVPFHNFARASNGYSKSEIGRETVERTRTTCAHILNQVLELVLRFQFWCLDLLTVRAVQRSCHIIWSLYAILRI